MPKKRNPNLAEAPCFRCNAQPRVIGANGHVYSYCRECQAESWRRNRAANAEAPCARCAETARLASGSYCGPCKAELVRQSAQRQREAPCSTCGSAPRALHQTRCLPCAKEATDASKRRRAGDPCSTCSTRARQPRSTQCVECQREATRQYRLRYPEGKDPERRRQVLLRRRLNKYGLTVADFLRLIEEQGNACAICGRDLGSEHYIDHNHETNEVRGLLCSPCNQGLGIFEDEPHLLEVAAAYLHARP